MTVIRASLKEAMIAASTYRSNISAQVRSLAPGVALSVIIAMAATFLSEHHGGPTLLYALLIGMAFYFLSVDGAAKDGIAFTGRSILRLGVALLGVRISTAQIASLGWLPIALMIVGVVATIAAGWHFSRTLRLSREQGILTGGAVAICGASAAMAISAVLPKHENSERDTLLTVISVTVMSTVAMVLYPLLVRALGFDDRAAGILLGGTIHDVAQVVGAGQLFSESAAVIATYVKLLRVAMLLPVVLVISAMLASRPAARVAARQPLLPMFLAGFVALAIANSLGAVPSHVSDVMAVASRWCLVAAIAALGMKTSLQELAKVGWRPLALVAGETLFLLALVLAGLLLSRTS